MSDPRIQLFAAMAPGFVIPILQEFTPAERAQLREVMNAVFDRVEIAQPIEGSVSEGVQLREVNE